MATRDWVVSPWPPYDYVPEMPKIDLTAAFAPSDHRDRGDEDDAIKRTHLNDPTPLDDGNTEGLQPIMDIAEEKVVDDLLREVDRAHALDLEITDLRKIADIWRDRELHSQHVITNLMGDKLSLEERIEMLQSRIDCLVKTLDKFIPRAA